MDMPGNPLSKKMVQAKVNAAIDLIKNGSADEISEKLQKMDVAELVSKLDQLDPETLKEYAASVEDVRKRVSESDFKRLSDALGPQGKNLTSKIQNKLRQQP
jgi:hypothetical protein